MITQSIINVGETDVCFDLSEKVTFYVTPDNFDTFFTIVSNKNYLNNVSEDGHTIITNDRKKAGHIQHNIKLEANFNLSSVQFDFEHIWVTCHANTVQLNLEQSNNSETTLYKRTAPYTGSNSKLEVDTSENGVFKVEMLQGDRLYLNYSDFADHTSENTKISNIKVTLPLAELMRIRANDDVLKESDLVDGSDSDLLENIKNLKMVEKMYICQEDGIREVKEIHVGT